MTGEMSREEVTREAFPTHFAIADALGGTVHPFDQYQGPFVLAQGHRFWLSTDDGCDGYVYDQTTHRQSELFPMYSDRAGECAADFARDLLAGGGFNPDHADVHEDAARLADIGEA